MSSFGKRLAGEFDAEFTRLANDWYLKWHELARGEPVEVDDFRGGLLRTPTTAFDPVTEHAYWTAIRRYTDSKIDETFARIEREIGFRSGDRAARMAEEGSIALRSFLEKLQRHAVYTEYRLQARGYPDERYLASRRDDAILEEVHRNVVGAANGACPGGFVRKLDRLDDARGVGRGGRPRGSIPLRRKHLVMP
jgi:hypothetical protein